MIEPEICQWMIEEIHHRRRPTQVFLQPRVPYVVVDGDKVDVPPAALRREEIVKQDRGCDPIKTWGVKIDGGRRDPVLGSTHCGVELRVREETRYKRSRKALRLASARRGNGNEQVLHQPRNTAPPRVCTVSHLGFLSFASLCIDG